MSEDVTLNSVIRLQRIGMLETLCDLPWTDPHSDAFIVCWPAMVNSRPTRANIFDDNANDIILPYIKSYIDEYSRVDIVFDVY